MSNQSSVPPGTGGGGTLCHLIATNFAGGPEKQILELSRRLRERGWPVVIGSFLENRDSVELIENARQHGIPTFLIDTRSPFSPAAIFQLRRHLAEFDVDLMITHGYKANLVARLANIGRPVIQVPIFRGFTGEDWKTRLYEIIDRRVMRTFPHVLSVSNASRELLRGHGLDPDRIHVLHNAVDCDRTVVPVDLAREFSFDAGSKVLVAAGRLSPEKSHRYLVDAMRRIHDRDPSLRAVILGSGREQRDLEARIRAAGLQDHIVLGGFRTDVLACLAGADLVVNPSLTEGLPNVVLEAMSVGTAVVATDVGGVGELIESGRTGWLVPAADPVAMADTILAVMADQERREAVALAGQDRVVESFSFSGQERHFVEYCESLRSGQAPSRLDRLSVP